MTAHLILGLKRKRRAFTTFSGHRQRLRDAKLKLISTARHGGRAYSALGVFAAQRWTSRGLLKLCRDAVEGTDEKVQLKHANYHRSPLRFQIIRHLSHLSSIVICVGVSQKVFKVAGERLASNILQAELGPCCPKLQLDMDTNPNVTSLQSAPCLERTKLVCFVYSALSGGEMSGALAGRQECLAHVWTRMRRRHVPDPCEQSMARSQAHDATPKWY